MNYCKDCFHYKACIGFLEETVDRRFLTDFNPCADQCKDYINVADVALRAEKSAECPICHGTGCIGTTDWLTKHLSKKQLAEEKAKAIAEHEQHIKAEVAREIFEEIEREIDLALKSNYEARKERNDRGYYDFDDTLLSSIVGKINALRGMEYFIAELKKKYTETENGN